MRHEEKSCHYISDLLIVIKMCFPIQSNDVFFLHDAVLTVGHLGAHASVYKSAQHREAHTDLNKKLYLLFNHNKLKIK